MRGRSAWVLLAAILIGWLVVPRAVTAATTLIRIQDGAGSTKANVTEGHQLQVTDSAPMTFRQYTGSHTGEHCNVLVTVPSGKGFIVRDISIGILTSASDGFHVVDVYPNGNCSGEDLYAAPTSKVDVYNLELTPGFALEEGGKISFDVRSSAAAAVFIWGYQVPSADVPSTTSIN